MVTRDDVISAYWMFLGRPPETENAIEIHVHAASLQDLGQALAGSAEFKARNSANQKLAVGRNYYSPPMSVETQTDDASRNRMLDHIESEWRRMGETEPHWSVIVDEKFKPDRISENQKEFYRSGDGSLAAMLAFFERGGRDPATIKRVFELGCGVARVTSALASKFPEVTGADVSGPHLEVARSYLQANQISNVTLMRLDRLEKLRELNDIDLFYTMIVLQHNPPPLMREMLDLVLGRINPGGYAFFQLPTYAQPYEFSVDKYLAELRSEMEMHALPQEVVFSTLAEHDFDVVEVQEDVFVGYPGWMSHTFFAQRRRSAAKPSSQPVSS